MPVLRPAGSAADNDEDSRSSPTRHVSRRWLPAGCSSGECRVGMASQAWQGSNCSIMGQCRSGCSRWEAKKKNRGARRSVTSLEAQRRAYGDSNVQRLPLRGAPVRSRSPLGNVAGFQGRRRTKADCFVERLGSARYESPPGTMDTLAAGNCPTARCPPHCKDTVTRRQSPAEPRQSILHPPGACQNLRRSRSWEPPSGKLPTGVAGPPKQPSFVGADARVGGGHGFRKETKKYCPHRAAAPAGNRWRGEKVTAREPKSNTKEGAR